jgi:hypothetical protein
MEIQGVKLLNLTGGLRCVELINPIGVLFGVRSQRPAFSIGPTCVGSINDGEIIQSPISCDLNKRQNDT